MTTTPSFIAGYDAASDHYDAGANSYWERFGRRTLSYLSPRAGDRILDAGCGSGTFAIAAADAVGPGGHVLGVDLSSGLLALARQKARARALAQVSFEERDFMSLPRGGIGYDAVVSIFSVFFVEDLRAAASHLWSLVRPGGTLIITSWGPDLFEPAASIFWCSVSACRPDLQRPLSPWERLADTAGVLTLLRQCGAANVRVVAEPGRHALHEPEDWWAMILGSGFRDTVERLTGDERVRVREENIRRLHEDGVRSVTANTVYGIARKRPT